MIITEISPRVSLPPDVENRPEQKKLRVHFMMLVCLVLACIGTSWFTYQYLLVPQQSASYAPDWHGAQWIQPADGTSTVAYYRYTTNISALPDSAFVTITASQVFDLSVNTYVVGRNFRTFQLGNSPQTFIFDVDSLLHTGINAFAIRVSNYDNNVPKLRMSVGFVQGKSAYYSGTGENGWKATIRSDLAMLHYSDSPAYANDWRTNTFDASSWSNAQIATTVPAPSMLTVDPALYERPISNIWMGVGPRQEAYFVRRFQAPSAISNAWLRIVAVGNANVFINGHLVSVWNSEPNISTYYVTNYSQNDDSQPQYQSGLLAGLYNITPYLQSGENTLAIHVTAPTEKGESLIGLDSISAAMATDVLFNDSQGHQTWLKPNGWHASTRAVDGWVQGSDPALNWAGPVNVPRPGQTGTINLSIASSTRNLLIIPFISIVFISLGCIFAVLGLWLVVSLVFMRRYFHSSWDALETMSLAFVPALACEGLFIVLSFEPSIEQSFPYTMGWGLVLCMLVALSFIFLGLNASLQLKRPSMYTSAPIEMQTFSLIPTVSPQYSSSSDHGLHPFLQGIFALLRIHWPFVLIVLIATPLICYNLPYEPYWQDELTSIFAAKGILAHGIPILPSGFVYTKAELYSYMLALDLAIFGDQNGGARILSIIEYLLSLPLMYIAGTYFFERRIAIIATALLAFSPMVLIWGRQARMYEQAQLFTLLTIYLIYRALHEPRRVYLVYLAIASLVLTYLSHEETFILLPGIVIWVLVTSKDEKRPAFAVFFQKHWWIAGTLGASIIVGQLVAVHLAGSPILGTDQTQTPFIQFTTNNVSFYLKSLFAPWAYASNNNPPPLTLSSILAAIGCILAFKGKDLRARFCAWMLLSSMVTLVFIFGWRDERYFYPILSVYYLMAAYALLRVTKAIWTFPRVYQGFLHNGRISSAISGNGIYVRMLAALTVLLLCASVVISAALPLNGYNLFLSRQLGISSHVHYPDYVGMGQYMHQHWRKGDIVISIIPDICTYYYVGHSDYFFSLNRSLFLFERNSQIIDTSLGSPGLLNQADFLAAITRNSRVWIVSDNSVYQNAVLNRFTLPPSFHMVYSGYASSVYLSEG